MWSSAGGRRRGVVSLLAVLYVVLSCATGSEGLDSPPLAPIQDSITLPERDDVNLRLPNNTIPIRYDVFFTTRIDVGDFNYDGHVDIEILCVEPTSTVVLHNRISQISRVIFKSGTAETTITNFSTDEETEFLTIQLDSPLVKDQQFILSIDFTGEHAVDNVGWYRASYTSDNGQEVWFATSHFEAPNARQAFPCYDEPDKKAAFAIQITHSALYRALSNMPITNYVIHADGTATTTFNETAVMSTYLLAFVVSDFEADCTFDAKSRVQCVYARPNAMHLTQWGLETAVQGLVELENILKVEYSLPKMDQIAVSDKDFSAGAMENWGLVIYRESRLLIDESSYNYKEKDSIGTVILHEFAHQWFGDLVSPKWWTYLWLNEGFATLFEYYATHKVYPDMRLPDLMVLESMQNIMATDAGDNPRPMTHYVETKTNIRSLFDYVSYQKAGTILRMMMLALGEETFYSGLTYYLEEMAYKNAVAEDLFAGIQKAVDDVSALPTGLTVKTIMDSWTLQGGYPLITANRDSQTKVTLKQNKFKVNDPNTPQSDFYIPISFTEGAQINFTTPATNNWFRGDAAQYDITINEQSSWYILNTQQSAYYRVNYDENNWRQLALALRDEGYKTIHLLNRAALLDDSMDLALNGRLNVTIAFDIFKYLENEVDYIPWAAVENGLRNFYNKIKVSDGAEAFNAVLANMTSKLYAAYGVWSSPDDVYFTHLARNFAIRWACEVGLAECHSDASDVLAQNFHNGLVLDRNYENIIACAAFRSMNETNYQYALGQVDGTGVGKATRSEAIEMLLCTYNPEFLKTTLSKFIDAEPLFTEAERVYILRTLVARDIQALETVLEFMSDNSDLLKAIISVADVAQVFTSIASASYSERLSPVILDLARKYENSLGNDAIVTLEAQLKKNLDWMSATGDVVVEFMTGEGEPDGATTIIMSSMLLFAALFVALLRV